MAVAGLRLYLFFNPQPPPPDLRPHQELGRVLAAEAVRLAGASGRIVVIGREYSEFKVPAAQAQIGTFQDSVRKAGRPAPTLRLAKVDPLRTLAMPSGEFFEIIRQAQEEDVIVSFLGATLLSGDQMAKLPQKRPKILAVCPHGMLGRIDLPAIFNQGLLVAALVGRPDAPAVLPPGETPGAALAGAFQRIDQTNLADLAALVPSPGGTR